MGVASLLSDAGHEMATAVLPGFLAALGVSAAGLGIIEGVADALSSAAKLTVGWLSDRLVHRKRVVVAGYLLTGASTGLFAACYGSAAVLMSRVVGWLGRGGRTPLRDAMLAGSVGTESRGKAFGFHRAGDTIGAIIGPLLAVGFLAHFQGKLSDPTAPFRRVFLLSLIPGLGSAVAFGLLVREESAGSPRTSFLAAVRNLPRGFRQFLLGAGIFGMGDFARTLMILAATQLLTSSHGAQHATRIAALLYVGHNLFYAAYSYPMGALSDRIGRRGLLALGYLAGALVSVGFLAAFYWRLDVVVYLLALFGLGGFSLAVVDTLEGAMTADLVWEGSRGAAYGVLGTVNGVGDFVASTLVGVVWAKFSPTAAFASAAVLMGVGAGVIYTLPNSREYQCR
jgi:MFS family permease